MERNHQKQLRINPAKIAMIQLRRIQLRIQLRQRRGYHGLGLEENVEEEQEDAKPKERKQEEEEDKFVKKLYYIN